MAETVKYQIHVEISEDNTLILQHSQYGHKTQDFITFADAVNFAKRVKINPKRLDETMCENTFSFLRKAKYEIIEFITVRTCSIKETL